MRMDWCVSFLWLVNYLRWTQCVHFSQLCYLGPVSSPLLDSSSLGDEAVGLRVICKGPFISFPRQIARARRTTTISTNRNSTKHQKKCLGQVAWRDLSGPKGSEEAALKSWRMFTVILCFWGQRTSTPRMQEVSDIQEQRKEIICP